MSQASWALQKALYTSLSAHVPLIAEITGIYDAPPQDAVFPYITIGDDIVSDASAKAMVATDHRVVVHVWARSPGKAQVKQLLQRVQDALDNKPPAPVGFMLGWLRFLQSTVLTDADGLTQHGVLEFRGRLCPL
jgi:Protein of unknown function (DUF3168)